MTSMASILATIDPEKVRKSIFPISEERTRELLANSTGGQPNEQATPSSKHIAPATAS